MCFRRREAKVAKTPKRVKVFLGQGKPTGELKKWVKRQEKRRKEALKAIDKEIAREDARRLHALRKKKPKNG